MKATTLLKRVDMQFAACAVATSASLTGVHSSQAAIVYSGAVSINIPSTVNGIYLNVVTGASASSGAGAAGWDINPWGSTDISLFSPLSMDDAYVGSAGFFNLSISAVIGPGSTFSDGTISATSPNPLAFNSANNLVGFRFQNEAMGNQLQYGWFRFYLSSTPQGQPRMIVDYAYDNSGSAIAAPFFPPPVVPEPNTVMLLGLVAAGACGIRAWRRRKIA